jgi:hypothetical protein
MLQQGTNFFHHSRYVGVRVEIRRQGISYRISKSTMHLSFHLFPCKNPPRKLEVCYHFTLWLWWCVLNHAAIQLMKPRVLFRMVYVLWLLSQIVGCKQINTLLCSNMHVCGVISTNYLHGRSMMSTWRQLMKWTTIEFVTSAMTKFNSLLGMQAT